jgi:O-antigen/teichoic acid export membrane protein
MLNRFFKDSAVYTFGNVLTRGIAIVLLPVYTRLLSPSEYGIVDLINIVGSFINVTIALEIGQGFGRYYADAPSEKDKLDYSSTSYWFVLFVYTFFLIAALIFSKPLNNLIIGQKYRTAIFQVGLLSIWGGGIFTYLRNQLRWYLKSKYFALVSVIFTLVSYSTTIFLMVVLKLNVIGVFWGLLLGYLIANFLSWYFSRENYKLNFDWTKFKEMVSFSLPLVPGSVGTILLLYVDRIAIKNLMTLSDVGIFGIAYRFAAIIGLLLGGFQTALIPLIYQNYKKSETPGDISKIFNYFLFAILSFIILLSFFSHELLVIFTTPDYYGAAEVIPIIAFATMFLSLYIFAPGLNLVKKTKIFAAINITSGVLNLILNYCLIPVWGILGASLSTLISGIFMFSINMIFSQKYYKIPFNWEKIVSSFSVSFIIVVAVIYMEKMLPIQYLFLMIIKFAVALISIWLIIKLLLNKNSIIDVILETKKIIRKKN